MGLKETIKQGESETATCKFTGQMERSTIYKTIWAKKAGPPKKFNAPLWDQGNLFKKILVKEMDYWVSPDNMTQSNKQKQRINKWLQAIINNIQGKRIKIA